MKAVAGIVFTLTVLLVVAGLCAAIVADAYADAGKATRNIQLPPGTTLYVNGSCVVDCPDGIAAPCTDGP